MIKIPSDNWHMALADAIRTAVDGETIVVDSAVKKELAELAIERMGRGDLRVEVA